MALGPTPQERALKMQTVLLRAMSGELNWIQAADLRGVSPRTMRRWRVRLQLYGTPGWSIGVAGPRPGACQEGS